MSDFNFSFNIDYLFIIYSCQQNLHKSKKIFNMYSDTLKFYNVKTLIMYGDTNIDNKYKIVDDTYLVLNVTDDYANLYLKSLRLFKTIIKKYPTIKGCFKCDDDIILNVDSIFNFINNLVNLDINYAGFTCIVNKSDDTNVCKHRYINIKAHIVNPATIYCGGPLYYLSNKSLHMIKEANEKDVKKLFYEDKMIGHILNQRGIFPVHSSLYSDNIELLNDKYSYHNIDHKNTLYLRIHGGLGNQMFQIASGYGIAKDNDMNFIVLNSSVIKSDFTHVEDNDVILNSIFKNFPNIQLKYITDIRKDIQIYKQEDTDCFLYKELTFNDDIILNGYFQNEKYFMDYKDELINYFKSNKLYNKLKKIFYKNGNYVLKNSYFIHVRRGDYVNNKLYEIDYDLYYQKAIEKILEVDKDAEFHIFSNDVEYCKTYHVFNNINKKILNNQNCLESIYLMSFCEKGGICANSSFSWWGSYLNTNPKKIVTFPSKWLNNDWVNEIYYENSIIIQI
jgi:hypothetical protein